MIISRELLVCKSTNHMLRADSILTKAQIPVELVPTPSRYGEICSTAIRFSSVYLEQVNELLHKHRVDFQGIYREKPYLFPDLLSKAEKTSLPSDMIDILKKVSQGVELDKQEIVYLLALTEEKAVNKLFYVADRVRKDIIGDIVDIRGAVEFSNYCTAGCLYCGLRKENKSIPRYRMSKAEILQAAGEVAQLGLKTIILQSGEDPWYTIDKLEEIVADIKKLYKLRITLSVGERSFADIKRLRTAGGNNYLLKIESSNPKLYQEWHPHGSFDNRLNCLRDLKKSGFKLGSGNIIGMPGQSVEDLAEDIIFCQQEGIHMVGIGPFVPAPNTPLSNHPAGDVLMTLKTVAVARIVLKNVFIPATTALASVDPKAFVKALAVGANTIMLINTPAKYSELYGIYSNKRAVDLQWSLEIIDQLGRQRPKFLAHEEGGKVIR